jgi:hypothetical protein
MQATVKKSIKPVTITVTLVAKKVNENGTFSSFEVQSVKGSMKNSTLRVATPPQGGGAIYLKVDSLEGLEMIERTTQISGMPKVKLF